MQPAHSKPYPFSLLPQVLQGRVLSSGAGESRFSLLGYDSRLITDGAQTLFFALVTKGGNGHRYLEECWRKGVRQFVVEDERAWNVLPDEVKENSHTLLVEDALKALQQLAAWHRAQLPAQIIGITGSNGKTTVKEWLYELLSYQAQVVRSPKSFNSQVGVPLSVWEIGPQHQYAIIEAGISQKGEMERLEEVIRPSVGIFTNIGEAHQAGFASVEEKIDEKLRLFRGVQTLVYPLDDKTIGERIKQFDFEREDVKLVGWSFEKKADLQVIGTERTGRSTKLTAVINGEELQAEIPFTDAASIENCACIWATLAALGVPELMAYSKGLHPVEMRLQLLDGINGCTLINDAYNSDLHALRIALDTLAQQRQHRRRTVILSDILESGWPEERLYREVAALLKAREVNRLIGIGPGISKYAVEFSGEKHFYPNTHAFLEEYELDSFRNEAILIKGARTFGFEAIAQRLQQKAHRTVLEINLSAVVHNFNVYRSRLRPSTRLMIMVKALSYGSGTYEIANVLQFHKADYLAVAYADEGVGLRRNGIGLPVMVMNPEERSFPVMIAHRLEPEIFSFAQLEAFAAALGSGDAAYPFSIHLKIDTGMHRLGFAPEEIDALADRLLQLPQIRVASAFSHLSASDMPEHDAFTHEQAQLFELATARLRERLGYSFLRHLLNSSGITCFPQYQYDMVRLGLGLYGIDPAGMMDDELEQVSTLKTHISQIRQVQAGESVGYARKGAAEKDRTIATIGIGYADGFPRALSNGRGQVWVHGQRAPVVGNVCMDMTMIDITGIPAQVGDEVVIFGPQYPVTELAAQLDTIAYEVLTNVSGRVKRVYYKE